MGYLRDKSDGDFAERQVAGLMEVSGFQVGYAERGNPHWDLRCQGRGLKFRMEVKYDRLEQRTGRVAVEYWNTRTFKPSGISVTRAELWAYVLSPLSIWVCKTADLKRYFHNDTGRHVVGGDKSKWGGGSAAMKLYAKDELFDRMFYRLDVMGAGEIQQLVGELLGCPAFPAHACGQHQRQLAPELAL